MNDFDSGGAIAEEEEEVAALLGVAKSRNGFVAGLPAIILVGCCCKACFNGSEKAVMYSTGWSICSHIWVD